jgi:cytochrome c biogenesis protein CcmG/thiol:disulfide interchange protein DsbE
MTRREILAALSAAALGANACGSAPKNAAPDFSGEDSMGNRVRLSDQAGKVVIVDFWMTTCAPCKVEIPWFMEFATAYRERGLVVLGVAVGETWDEVRPFLAEHGINYPILLGDDELADRYRVSVLPTTVLLDRKGRIAHVHEGLAEKDLLREEIEALL